MRAAVFWRSFARGCVERFLVSSDISSPEALASELSELFEVLPRFFWLCFLAAEG